MGVQKIKELANTDSGAEVEAREKMKTDIIQLEKDANEYEKEQYAKAMEAQGPKACTTCGSMYKGQEEYDAHLSYKIHKSYEKVLARNEELKESVKNVPAKAELAALEKEMKEAAQKEREKIELKKKEEREKERRSRSRRRNRSQ